MSSRTAPGARDSLELASLASSSPSPDHVSDSSLSGVASSRKLSSDDEEPLHRTLASRATLHGRSYSVTSAFDFAPALAPLSTISHGYTALGVPGEASFDPSHSLDGGSLERHKSLTFMNGMSLIVGLIIGSGIFSSPAQVNFNAGSPGASLIVWVVAGALAWTGASSYAELGGAIPLNGGAQVYLAKIFGEAVGFLFSWCSVCVLKPGSGAIIAIIFGEYIVKAFMGANEGEASVFLTKGVAIAGLVAVSLLNCISTKLAARSADVFMFLKFAALLGITVTGIVVAITGFSWVQPSTDWKTHGWFEGTNENASNLAVALYAGLWAFDGWDNVNFVAGEFINPSRDLPRVIHTSLPLVIVSYLVANTAYFLVLPLTVTSSSQTIAVAFGAQVLGPLGSLVLALTVSGSCFGALNATTFTTSRLFYAAAKEGYLPSIFGGLGFSGTSTLRLPNQTRSAQPMGAMKRMLGKLCVDEDSLALFLTPIPAILLNFSLTTLYVTLGTFSTLITFYGVAGYLFYFLTVLGLLVLRVKEPNLERPYKCWITTPIIFCCVSLFLLSRSVVAEPLSSLSVVAFIIVGFVVYMWRVKPRQGAQHRRSSSVSDWQFWKLWFRA